MDFNNLFKKAYETGRTGEVSRFNEWLSNFGLDRKGVESLFNSNDAVLRDDFSEFFVNREEEITQLAKVLGYHEKNPVKGYVHIIGPFGVGKTTILRYIFGLCQSMKDNHTQVSFIDAARFSNCIDDSLVFDEWLERMRNNKVGFVDHCERDLGKMRYNLKKSDEYLDRQLIIYGWEGLAWERFQIDHKALDYLIADEHSRLFIEPLSMTDSEEVIRRRLNVIKPSPGIEPFTKESIKKIVAISEGLPGVILLFTYDCLMEASLRDTDVIDEGLVIEIASKLNIYEIGMRFDDLSNLEKHALYLITSEQDERGLYANKLADMIGRERPTVAIYLSKLLEKGFLESTRYGKYMFYKVKKRVKPLLQLYIFRIRRDMDE